MKSNNNKLTNKIKQFIKTMFKICWEMFKSKTKPFTNRIKKINYYWNNLERN